ncbi:MAG TPA: hypothetical protein VD738_09235 [Nitrospira sp.]|nr:hypothetical protein [Nitrospira sp.]
MSGWSRYGMAMLGILVAAPCLSAQANEGATEPRSRVELSLRSWLFTSGETTWSHNASGLDPTLGNPTSKLTYKDNDTHIIEFGAKVHFGRRWYLQGDGGVSVDFDRGTLIDDDFLAGQYLFSRTSSAITGTGTWYVNGNLGYRAVEFPNGRGYLNVFGGFRYWRTTYEATGFDRLVCDSNVTSCVPQGSTALAITNTTHWITPVQAGIDTDYRLTGRLSIGLRASVSPVSVLYNTDTHHLRSDLQQDPSFAMWGVGVSASAEPVVKFMVTRHLALTGGYRVWWNRTYAGTWETHPVGSGSQTAPLTEFQTIRHGATVGLTAFF